LIHAELVGTKAAKSEPCEYHKGLQISWLAKPVRKNKRMGFPKWNSDSVTGERSDRERGLTQLDGEPQTRFAASSIGTIRQGKFAAMSFRNLAAEDETNPGSTLFRGEEWHEEIRRLWEA
jgi:hypothetical protein